MSHPTPTTTAHNHPTQEIAVSDSTTKAPRPRITPETADLSDPLWTNAHLRRYLHCGSTALVAIKDKAGFPAAVQIGGLQRYPAEQVKAYVLAQQTQPTTTTLEGTQP